MFLGLVYIWFTVGMIEFQHSFEGALMIFFFVSQEKDPVFCFCQTLDMSHEFLIHLI